MKTLKKTLCLILAVVMVVGVLILPANAASIKDYKDNEDIKYKEAVEVLSGLGILGGKDTGYFAPKGTLTRAEAAKIIAWMLLGEDAEKLHSNTQIFADVAAGNWAAGYIAFCKNEGILAGDGAGNFRPNGELNGVDFGKMLLTALGYDAKLEGYVLNKDWDKNVTTQMLNKNSYIDIGTVLSNPMTREEAAQMAFLALQQSTVKYPTTIYGTSQSVLTGTTLGDRFGLERVKGVMTANEYADLDSSWPAGNGKSVIGGKTYNYASDLTEIGLYYEGWACGQSGTKTIIHLEAVGNTVWENHGVATSLANFRQVTGMGPNNSVGYINFGETYANYEADIRIVYDVDGEGPEEQVVIKAGAPISSVWYDEMKSIFDKTQQGGWIAVGTVDVVDDTNDLSDTISWNTFRSRYLNDIADTGVDVAGANQGEWLKVIDNDRDGYADYVFLTTFTMTTVTGVAKDGKLTLNGLAATYDYATSADLARGDVVIYTPIDGTYYVEPAPSFTGKVDKYTYKTDVLTVEGEDYPQSGINEYMNGYITVVESAKKDTEYTYYQDFFGNIRALEVPASSARDLVLLTDGWYRVTKSNDEYAVKAYLDEEIGTYDVNAKSVGGFVNQSTGDNNSWGNLVKFAPYTDQNGKTPYTYGNNDKGKTNLARYSQDEDGVLSLADAKTYTSGKNGTANGIATDYVDLNEAALAAGQRTYDGKYVMTADDTAAGFRADTGNSVRVQANSDTVFYYVWYNKDVAHVVSVTGYKNTYAVAADDVLEAYAVARNTNADSTKEPYWVAEAIVIETDGPVYGTATNVVLGYNVLNKTVRDFGDLESVLADASLTELEVEHVDGLDPVNYNTINRTGTIPNPAFYLSSATEGTVDITSITENFGRYNIYVATIDRSTSLKDYIVAVGGKELGYSADDVVVYDLDPRSKANVISSTDPYGDDLTLNVGESYILVADTRGNIVYAVLNDAVTADLYDKIEKDAKPEAKVSIIPVLSGSTTPVSGLKIDGITATVSATGNSVSFTGTPALGGDDDWKYNLDTGDVRVSSGSWVDTTAPKSNGSWANETLYDFAGGKVTIYVTVTRKTTTLKFDDQTSGHGFKGYIDVDGTETEITSGTGLTSKNFDMYTVTIKRTETSAQRYTYTVIPTGGGDGGDTGVLEFKANESEKTLTIKVDGTNDTTLKIEKAAEIKVKGNADYSTGNTLVTLTNDAAKADGKTPLDTSGAQYYKGDAITFTVENKDETKVIKSVTYKLDSGSDVVLTAKDGVYTIPAGTAPSDDITITVNLVNATYTMTVKNTSTALVTANGTDVGQITAGVKVTVNYNGTLTISASAPVKVTSEPATPGTTYQSLAKSDETGKNWVITGVAADLTVTVADADA